MRRVAAVNRPEAEHHIDDRLVRELLEDQFPGFACMDIKPLGEGWDNVVFRLGCDYVVRLPRHAYAASLLENELRWLPTLAERLPLHVPVPLHEGCASACYPWPWCITRWLPGEVAALRCPSDNDAAAETMGRFLAALHQPAPTEAPRNPFRGIELSARAKLANEHLTCLDEKLGARACSGLRSLWEELLQVPAYGGAPRWLHGDLHPANILVDDGRIVSVLDFGDVCAGDPATDLAVMWMLLPKSSHRILRRAYGRAEDDSLWLRARAWALTLGLAAAASSTDHSIVQGMARRTLQRVTGQDEG